MTMAHPTRGHGRRRRRAVVAAVVVGLTALIGCGDDDVVVSDSTALDVFGPYRGVEADRFAASLEGFEIATGIEVNYTGSADFVEDLTRRMESGLDAPDIAVVPQPGLVARLAERDQLVPLDDATLAMIDSEYGERAASLIAGVEGVAAPYRVSPKSLVWFRPEVFQRFGWEVPDDLAALEALVDEIEADDAGIAPWCFSMASGSATGWAATDWLEDMVLRQAGVEVYDRWTAGELAWDDPVIREALDTVDQMVVRSGRSTGGLRTIVELPVERASEPLFDEPPGCAMYKQASFAQSWFPESSGLGLDLDVFVLPDAAGSEDAPMLVGADTLVQFSDDPDVHRLMEYLVSADGGREWARRGGYLSGRTSVDPGSYHTDADQGLAELLLDGRPLRLDASDAMPPEVGAGLLWREMTSWVSGVTSTDQLVVSIDDALATAS